MASLRDGLCGFIGIDQQRVVVELNEEAERLLERARADVIGKKLSQLLSASGRIFFQTQVFPELALRERLEELYLSLLKGNGEDMQVLLSVGRASPGEGFDYGCYFLPIHRRSLFERELLRVQQAAESSEAQVRAMREQLAIQERLVTLGELAAGVAHEINNPLTYVAGNLTLLGELLRNLAPSSAEAQREILDILGDLGDGVSRIRDITASLRHLSRADNAARTVVDLHTVIEAAMRVAAHALRSTVTVTLDVTEPHPWVEANEGRLVQVVVNLLVNAAQAMPKRSATENRIVVRAHSTSDDFAVLEVEDNGTGVPGSVKARIFDPFFTTKPVGEGTGLGLSVCHNIVTELGGSISVHDAPSGGTLFSVRLPLTSKGSGARPRNSTL